MIHVIGSFIGWVIAGTVGALPAWILAEWGREVLFGERDMKDDHKEDRG